MADFAAYVFYVNRPDLLRRSLDSFSELWPELTIVDNSIDGLERTDANPDLELLPDGYWQPLSPLWPSGVRVFRPPVPLTWSQSANWMLKDATEKGVDFIVHFHSDATSSNPQAVNQLLEYARRVKAEGTRWACLWTLYDVLWIVNPVAARDVGGWDTTFQSYFVDQVQKMRWKLKGWETINTGIEGITHEGSATVRSDPKLDFVNRMTFPLYEKLYRQMWAGDPGNEKYDAPFGRPDIFS